MQIIRRRFTLGSLAVVAVLVFSLTAISGAAAPIVWAGGASNGSATSPTSIITLVGNHIALPAGAVAVGDVPSKQALHLVVGLRLRDSDALRRFVVRLQSTPVPERTYLTAADVLNRYAPTADQYQKVQNYLIGIGCTIDRTYSNRFVVDATCSAAVIHKSLGVQIRTYRDASGHEFYANQSDPRLPADVGSLIQSIGGLDNLPIFRSHVRTPSRASIQGFSGYSPQNILTAYDASAIRSLADGTGQTIAILTAYGYNYSDITSFDQEFSLPNPQLTNVPIDGSIYQATSETPLDVEWSHAMAPGAKVVVYEASDTTPSVFTDMYNRALSDNLSHVWSTSWGECEDQQPWIYTDQSIFAAAAAEGISIYAASGDSGGYDCVSGQYQYVGVDYPASDPSVTGVGGTSLLLYSNSSIESETAWTGWGTAGGSGGGVSDIFSQPWWQSAVASYSGRAVPDVAFDADPNTGLAVVLNGSPQVIGGTSDAAPSWAGLAAVLNQYGHASIGYADPLYYQSNVRSTFHDITQGNNGVYYAGPGYDPVTGLGSPDVGALARAIFPNSFPTATPSPTATPMPTFTPTPLPTATPTSLPTAISTIPPTPTSSAGSEFTYVGQWGSYGTGDGQLEHPNGIAISPSGDVYVAEGGRVQEFTASGTYLTKWGSPGSGDGQFYGTWGVAVGPDGSVYVTDFGNNRVEVFSSSGQYETQWGTLGNGTGQFLGPIGIAAAPNGDVYVADEGNARVEKFTASGTYLGPLGSYGTGPGQLQMPIWVATDKDGNVLVWDASNRVEMFNSSGTFLNQWGSTGTGPGQFDYGMDALAVDHNGNVYVTDSVNDRVQVFNESGQFLTQWGSQGASSGEFVEPQGVAVGSDGDVYVTDFGNARVQVFVDFLTTPNQVHVPIVFDNASAAAP